ncbi:MAG: sugar ABC transporter permease [Anaerolineae bacterium]|nr:sugar ABC transporter permease [Anaerolineae bacterium]
MQSYSGTMPNAGGPARRMGMERREMLIGWLTLSPWAVGFLVFTLGPMVASLYLSFSEYKIIQAPNWVGLANYQRMLDDPLFYKSLSVTVMYSLTSVPLGIFMALIVAVLLNQDIWGARVMRTIFYLPSVISGVAVSLVFAWIFNHRFGILNYIIGLVGIRGPDWLGWRQWALPAFVLMSLWGIGGNMIILLAGLQGVPAALHEAAEIDGANSWRRFWRITLPMISPAILFVGIMSIIGSFQTFTQAFIMTGGGPAYATLFYVLYLYRNAFTWFEMGYASALAWVLFAIILLCTLLSLRVSRSWVHYEGG